MKLVLKIGAGLLIALTLLVVGAFATLYLKAATPEARRISHSWRRVLHGCFR